MFKIVNGQMVAFNRPQEVAAFNLAEQQKKMPPPIDDGVDPEHIANEEMADKRRKKKEIHTISDIIKHKPPIRKVMKVLKEILTDYELEDEESF